MLTLSVQQDKAVSSVNNWYRGAKKRWQFSDVDLANPNCDITADKFYLGGYAGSGKTSILPFIIDKLGLPLGDVAFAAPTGKAAKVMTTKLKGFGMDTSATTIHSLIYIPNKAYLEMLMDRKDEIAPKLSEALGAIETYRAAGNEEAMNRMKDYAKQIRRSMKEIDDQIDEMHDRQDGPTFRLNPESALKTKQLVVIDESSMVGQAMAADLRNFGVPVLAIGDPGQLPPVGDLPGLCIDDPDYFLSEIHRQARDNPIIRLSQDVRAGNMLKVFNSSCGLVDVIRRRDDTATYDMDREAQVLVGTNRNRWKITKKLRRAMGYLDRGPYEGEPLIICRNSKRFPDLINGTFVETVETVEMEEGNASFEMKVRLPDTGVIYTIPVCQGILEENFLLQKGEATCSKNEAYRSKTRDEHLDYGHAITVHKSQGSQWDDVIVHDESGVFRDDAAKWLYTAVTRAAHRLTVVI